MSKWNVGQVIYNREGEDYGTFEAENIEALFNQLKEKFNNKNFQCEVDPTFSDTYVIYDSKCEFDCLIAYKMIEENANEDNRKIHTEENHKEEKQMELLKEYSQKFGLEEVINDMGERRKTRENSIVFPNGWVASIVKNRYEDTEKKGKYSVAMCDYDGYFDWHTLNTYGANDGCFYCNTELEVLIACETIRRLEC